MHLLLLVFSLIVVTAAEPRCDPETQYEKNGQCCKLSGPDSNHAIVKHNLWGDDEDLPKDFCVGGYSAAGKYKKKGENDYKERHYAGAGVGHIYDHGAEIRGPNAAAGVEETKHSVTGVAQAEVYSLSASDGDFKAGVDVLKAGAGYNVDQYGVKVGAEAGVYSLSASDGDFKAGVDALTAGAGYNVDQYGVNAGAEAEVLHYSVSHGPVGVKADVLKADAKFRLEPTRLQAKVEAKVAEVSATAGPVTATAAVDATTGVNIDEGVEVQVLGTGVKIGREIGFSLFGTGFTIKLW